MADALPARLPFFFPRDAAPLVEVDDAARESLRQARSDAPRNVRRALLLRSQALSPLKEPAPVAPHEEPAPVAPHKEPAS